MALSREERLRRHREVQRKRRKRIQDDPELLEEANEKRRRAYAILREKKKNKKLTKKETDAQRKKWRIAKRKYLQKKKDENPEAEVVQAAVSSRSASMKKRAKQRAESHRVQHYHEVQRLKNRVAVAERKASRYKQRYYRERDKNLNNSESPKSKLNRELRKESSDLSPSMKRRLLFNHSVAVDIKDSLSEIRSTKKKHLISNIMNLRYVKKYRFISEAKPYFRYSFLLRKSDTRRPLGVKRRKMELVRSCVHKFLTDDENSTLSPAKSDQIVKKKIKKQKRFLTNSMRYLFRKFCETSDFLISYSLFCKLKPFWVVNRAVGARDTCLCIKCENARLLCESLKRFNVVNEKNIDELIEKELCCQVATTACWFRQCEKCRERSLVFLEFDSTEQCFYDTWQSKLEVGRDNKQHRHTSKERVPCFLHELVNRFTEDILQSYMTHKGNDKHQKKVMKEKKSRLTSTETFLHLYSLRQLKKVTYIT